MRLHIYIQTHLKSCHRLHSIHASLDSISIGKCLCVYIYGHQIFRVNACIFIHAYMNTNIYIYGYTNIERVELILSRNKYEVNQFLFRLIAIGHYLSMKAE